MYTYNFARWNNYLRFKISLVSHFTSREVEETWEYMVRVVISLRHVQDIFYWLH